VTITAGYIDRKEVNLVVNVSRCSSFAPPHHLSYSYYLPPYLAACLRAHRTSARCYLGARIFLPATESPLLLPPLHALRAPQAYKATSQPTLPAPIISIAAGDAAGAAAYRASRGRGVEGVAATWTGEWYGK